MMNPRLGNDVHTSLYVFDPASPSIDRVTMTDEQLYAKVLCEDFDYKDLVDLAHDGAVLDPRDDDYDLYMDEGDYAFVAQASKEELAGWLARQDGIATWIVDNDPRAAFVDREGGDYFPSLVFGEATRGFALADEGHTRDDIFEELADWCTWNRAASRGER